MNVLAIDPGNEHSAYVVLSDKDELLEFDKLSNEDMLRRFWHITAGVDHAAIEMVACYGMPVGKEVFDTALWVGRYMQLLQSVPCPCDLVYRKDVKLHLCQSTRGVNDAVIRQALIDRFGPGKSKAIGTKKAPGPLYGVKADVWAALAVGVTWMDQKCSPHLT